MRVDLHTHTFPASSCSQIDHDQFVRRCRELDVEAIAITNHGAVADNVALEGILAQAGIVLVHGIEISTLYGDFLIFSSDLEYLATLRDVQAFPSPRDVPERAAIVWAHPGAGGGRSGSSFYRSLPSTVAPQIDGIEVWNGNWTQSRFVETARTVGQEYLLAMTGGSDAHRAEQIGRCATEVPGVVRSTDDVVKALKERATTPVPPSSRSTGVLGRLLGRG